MLQAPRRWKYRKSHKMRIRQINYSKGGCRLKFGMFGLKALKSVRLLPEQIEAARRIIARQLKKKSKIWIRVFPDRPITQKPKEVRMGKGKGAVSRYIIRAAAGTTLFELDNVDHKGAVIAFDAARKKLPGPTAMIQPSKDLVHQKLL